MFAWQCRNELSILCITDNEMLVEYQVTFQQYNMLIMVTLHYCFYLFLPAVTYTLTFWSCFCIVLIINDNLFSLLHVSAHFDCC